MIREARPDAFLHHFVHIPWSQPDSWRILPGRIREAIFRGHARQRHHRLPHPRLLHQLPALLRRTARGRGRLRAAASVRHAGGETLARAYPLSIDAERLRRAAESPEVAEAEREVLERRRKHLIIRVDRADLSKNVLRGFTAFDTFLTQHPEFREAGHLHRPPAALAPGRARVRRVPGADRGPGRGRQPPPRHHRLDADRPARSTRTSTRRSPATSTSTC